MRPTLFQGWPHCCSNTGSGLGQIHLRRESAIEIYRAAQPDHHRQEQIVQQHRPGQAGQHRRWLFASANPTAREQEIGQLLLSGYSSKGIAQRLGIATDTVKAHRKHLYSKLGINSQAELFSLFLQQKTRAEAR